MKISWEEKHVIQRCSFFLHSIFENKLVHDEMVIYITRLESLFLYDSRCICEPREYFNIRMFVYITEVYRGYVKTSACNNTLETHKSIENFVITNLRVELCYELYMFSSHWSAQNISKNYEHKNSFDRS